MNNKENNILFRLNFALQDNNATTFNANLIKIIENEILISGHKLTSEEIQKEIENNVHLKFTEEEIKEAISEKGKDILFDNNSYYLKTDKIEKLNNQPKISDELLKYIRIAIKELNIKTTEQKLHQLIMDYLYYCFNANREVLIALIKNEPLNSSKNKNFNNEEINLINLFLQWDNIEKNKCIYNIISYCYNFCTLTIKNNNLFSHNLFRGKNFILDANIIFRLAGINNDSRKKTIESFTNKCKEIGIKLSYTTETLEEIYRVIKNKVLWIKGLNGYDKPVDWNKYVENDNDFYKIYFEWCVNEKNDSGDFVAFQKYLIDLLLGVMSDFEIEEVDNYEIINNIEFNSYCDALLTYKSQHSNRQQSSASIKTDIKNILSVKKERTRKKIYDFWSLNKFIISADQNLINWSNDNFGGVPLVVLPSVWLTILLKFSGRNTKDDYSAFCSFLEVREHSEENKNIDVFKLVESLRDKTNCSDVKRLIVTEIINNKDKYKIENEDDYKIISSKAFDEVINNMKKEEKKLRELKEQEIEKLKKEKEIIQNNNLIIKNVDVESKLEILAKKKYKNNNKVVKNYLN